MCTLQNDKDFFKVLDELFIEEKNLKEDKAIQEEENKKINQLKEGHTEINETITATENVAPNLDKIEMTREKSNGVKTEIKSQVTNLTEETQNFVPSENNENKKDLISDMDKPCIEKEVKENVPEQILKTEEVKLEPQESNSEKKEKFSKEESNDDNESKQEKIRVIKEKISESKNKAIEKLKIFVKVRKHLENPITATQGFLYEDFFSVNERNCFQNWFSEMEKELLGVSKEIVIECATYITKYDFNDEVSKEEVKKNNINALLTKIDYLLSDLMFKYFLVKEDSRTTFDRFVYLLMKINYNKINSSEQLLFLIKIFIMGANKYIFGGRALGTCELLVDLFLNMLSKEFGIGEKEEIDTNKYVYSYTNAKNECIKFLPSKNIEYYDKENHDYYYINFINNKSEHFVLYKNQEMYKDSNTDKNFISGTERIGSDCYLFSVFLFLDILMYYPKDPYFTDIKKVSNFNKFITDLEEVLIIAEHQKKNIFKNYSCEDNITEIKKRKKENYVKNHSESISNNSESANNISSLFGLSKLFSIFSLPKN